MMEYSMEPFPTRQARMQPGSTELLRTTSPSFSHQISRDRAHTFAEPRSGDAGGDCSILAARLGPPNSSAETPRSMSNLTQPPHERTAHPCLSEVEIADSHHRRPRECGCKQPPPGSPPKCRGRQEMLVRTSGPSAPPSASENMVPGRLSFSEAEAACEHQPQIATLPHGRATLTASYYRTSMARSTHLHREIDDADTPLHTMFAERGGAPAKEDRPNCGPATAILLPLFLRL
jgi:hypothetical protein